MLTLAQFELSLQQITSRHPVDRYVVAYSGGVDSHVLLHLCSQLKLPMRALHVHHGLQTDADHWSEHCVSVCSQLNIDCQTLFVDASPSSGESPEQGARNARYKALFASLSSNECLLTAHHNDDQSETLLLQLFRGAGPAGLASMPQLKQLSTGWHARPMLGINRDDILQYAKKQQLHWVDDPSNNETEIDRNFVRKQILPLIKQRWPQVDDSISQAAGLQQHSLELIETLAAIDLAAVVTQDNTVLSVNRLLGLSRNRLLNVLRYWLRATHYDNPTRNVLHQIVTAVLLAAEDATPLVSWANTEVRRYQDKLYVLPVVNKHDDHAAVKWNLVDELVLDKLGIKLSVAKNTGRGLTPSLLDEQMTVRFRQGGESIKPVGSQHTHSLKKLMQSASIPPWQRDRIPLLYADDQLVCVCGYWLADELSVSNPEEMGWQPIVSRLE